MRPAATSLDKFSGITATLEGDDKIGLDLDDIADPGGAKAAAHGRRVAMNINRRGFQPRGEAGRLPEKAGSTDMKTIAQWAAISSIGMILREKDVVSTFCCRRRELDASNTVYHTVTGMQPSTKHQARRSRRAYALDDAGGQRATREPDAVIPRRRSSSG